MEKIEYFVYTSGEEQSGQVDWAAKFATPRFPLDAANKKSLEDVSELSGRKRDDAWHTQLIRLSRAYERQIERYEVSPGLAERRCTTPEKASFVLLPWNAAHCMAGVYYNFHDLKGRDNIGLVMCAVPSELQKRVTPREFFAGLLACNDVKGIARPRGTAEAQENLPPRPETVDVKVPLIPGALAELSGMEWPREAAAQFVVNGQYAAIASKPGSFPIEESKKTGSQGGGSGKSKKTGSQGGGSGKSKKWLVLLFLLFVAAGIGGNIWFENNERVKAEQKRRDDEQRAAEEIATKDRKNAEVKRDRDVSQLVQDVLKNAQGPVAVFVAEELDGGMWRVVETLHNPTYLSLPAEPFKVSVTPQPANKILLDPVKVRKGLTRLLSGEVYKDQDAQTTLSGKKNWSSDVEKFKAEFFKTETVANAAAVDIESVKQSILDRLKKDEKSVLNIGFMFTPAAGVRRYVFAANDCSDKKERFTVDKELRAVSKTHFDRWLSRLTGSEKSLPTVDVSSVKYGLVELKAARLAERQNTENRTFTQIFTDDLMAELEKVLDK